MDEITKICFDPLKIEGGVQSTAFLLGLHIEYLTLNLLFVFENIRKSNMTQGISTNICKY